MKILYITAHPLSDEMSTSRRLSRNFIEEYKKNNPNDEIKELDLYKEGIDFLQKEDLEAIYANKESKVLSYAKEFAECDKYVIAAPMWNLSIPAILKAYVDYISYVGVTFKYTENGPVGLLNNKKAIFILSTGGIYSTDQGQKANGATPYMNGLLRFVGIEDVKSFMLEGTNYYPEEKAQEEFKSLNEELINIAKEW